MVPSIRALVVLPVVPLLCRTSPRCTFFPLWYSRTSKEGDLIDLEAHFRLIRPTSWVVAAVAALGSLLNYSLLSTPLLSVFIILPGIMIVGALVGARTQSRSYNASFAVLILVGLVALMISDTTVLTP